MNPNELDVIVPVNMELPSSAREMLVRDLLEQNRRYGFKRFALIFPGKGWRSAPAYPGEDYFREKALLLLAVKTDLEKYGIECAWWNTLTIKSGPEPSWHRMVCTDGHETPFSSCPLDENFRRDFARRCAIVAEIARPAFIITEDDFSINASTWPYGCFCELHLREYARRTGRNFTREEIVDMLKAKAPETADLRKVWLDLERDSLVGLATAVREAVDKVAPEIPIGTMQAGAWDCDGDATEAVTRAFAGKSHVPFSRLYGTFYGGETTDEIPEILFHALYSKQRIGDDIRCYHESDTFPHTRFFSSAATMRTLMASAYSFGFVGSTFQAMAGLDNPNEETAYGVMFEKSHPKFQAIFEIARQCRVQGVRLVYKFMPEHEHNPSWTRSISHFGIPYTSDKSSVTFLSDFRTAEMSDDEIRTLLHGNLFLDGGAAKDLFDRGFGKYIGADVGDNPICGMMKYDLESCEVIADGFIPMCIGRKMNRADFYSPRGNGKMYRLTPHDGTEVITQVVSTSGHPITAGMTRFVNEFGATVVVMGQGTAGNRCASLFNYRRQQLLQELIADCSDDFVFVKGAPRVYLVMNEAKNAEKSGFLGMLTLSNLNADALDSLTLHLPVAWRKVKEICLLDAGGHWQKIDFAGTDDGVSLKMDLPYADPQALLLK